MFVDYLKIEGNVRLIFSSLDILYIETKVNVFDICDFLIVFIGIKNNLSIEISMYDSLIGYSFAIDIWEKDKSLFFEKLLFTIEDIEISFLNENILKFINNG